MSVTVPSCYNIILTRYVIIYPPHIISSLKKYILGFKCKLLFMCVTDIF